MRTTFFIVLFWCGLSRAAHLDWCQELVFDRGEQAVEASSPVERWIASAGERVRPRNPQLQVAYVVPVYRELASGALVRLLARLQNQDVPASQLRVVLVLNNTPAAATQQTRAFRENQRTLEMLRGRLRPVAADLPDRIERRKFENGTEIDIMDLSTQGTRRVIGEIRQFGVAHLLQSHRGDLRNLIVQQFDADTIPSHHLTRELLTVFSDPLVDSVISAMEFRLPRGSSFNLHASHYRERGSFGRYDLGLALNGRPPLGGTPRLATRASLLAAVGGVPLEESCEDMALLERLSGRASHHLQWRYPTQTSDRDRIDGYDAADRARGLTFALERLNHPYQAHINDRAELVSELTRLEKALPAEEFAVLRAEVDFWRAQARADLNGPRSHDPYWETYGGSRWNKGANLEVRDLSVGPQGELAASVELSALNRAFSRFYSLARDYPDRFPVIRRIIRHSELVARFTNGFASSKPDAERDRRMATDELLNIEWNETELFSVSVQINIGIFRYRVSRRNWLQYLVGKWQDSVDGYGLSREQEKRLVTVTTLLMETALINQTEGAEEKFVPLGREMLGRNLARPRVLAQIVAMYRLFDREAGETLDSEVRRQVSSQVLGDYQYFLPAMAAP